MSRSQRRHFVYVIELDPAVLDSRDFRRANPDYVAGRRCVYVGQTARTPEERFAQHQAGTKSNRYARKHGLRLIRRYTTEVAGNTRAAAEAKEAAVAARLRKKGWAVWSH
jgi:predicted GIY-YIG superfamily endonuclease